MIQCNILKTNKTKQKHKNNYLIRSRNQTNQDRHKTTEDTASVFIFRFLTI